MTKAWHLILIALELLASVACGYEPLPTPVEARLRTIAAPRVIHAGRYIYAPSPVTGSAILTAYAPEVWFAPDEDCTAVIVAEFDKARKSIDYQLYNFTSEPIADALIRAHKRGVAVRILLDARAQSTRYSQAHRCKAAGIDVRLDSKHPISHNKVRIIDGKLLLGGSFNDSRQANRNAENLTREDDPAIVKEFADNFDRHWAHGAKAEAGISSIRIRAKK